MGKLATFILFLFSMNLFAKEYYKRSSLDKFHERFSDRVLSFSDSIDNFFADSKHQKNINKSKLKITFDTFFREGRGPYIRPDINYRLILPKTQRKLQLFIENDEQDKKDETDQAKKQLSNKQKRQDNNDLSAGLRYMINKSGIDFSTDTGIIVNIPIVVFAKFTAKKSIYLRNWVLKISEQVQWINNKGFSSDLDTDFDRKLTRKFLLRMVNNTFWNDQDYSIRFENGPSLFQKIDQKSVISYHAHAVTLNTPDFHVDNYILLSTYRRLVYGKWLYTELSPFINFPRSQNFHRTPGVAVSFQAIFGHI